MVCIIPQPNVEKVSGKRVLYSFDFDFESVGEKKDMKRESKGIVCHVYNFKFKLHFTQYFWYFTNTFVQNRWFSQFRRISCEAKILWIFPVYPRLKEILN